MSGWLARLMGEENKGKTEVEKLQRELAAKIVESPAAHGDLILERLREAVRQHDFEVLAQPVVSLPQRKLRFFELFSRLRMPVGEDLLPEDFIGVAEREGWISTIDNLQLLRAIQMVRDLRGLPQDVGFFCNVSAQTIGDVHFMDQLMEYLAAYPRIAVRMILEFSYDELAAVDASVSPVFARLSASGVRFSVDHLPSFSIDYGMLMERQVRFIKAGAAALVGLVQNKEGLEALDTLRSELMRDGIDLVADKIETDKELLEILDIKIDFGQGYLFGHPRPTQDVLSR